MPLPSINQSSNPGSFSDNFKEKASALKDKFLPKTLLDGLFGKSKTDGNKKLGADTTGQKNPQRSSISSGSNARLKTGDSIADIMAKQLIFMQKTYESDKERYDMERAHREEQMEEDERRHKKLIEGLKKVKKQTAIPEKEKEEQKQEEKKDGTPSWISKMLGGIKAAILSPFKLILGVVSSILGAVGSLVLGLTDIIISTITKSAEFIVNKLLLAPITSIITTVLGFVFKKFLQGLFSSVKWLARLIGGPLLAALGIASVAGDEFTNIQEEESYAFGPEVQDFDKFSAEEEIKHENMISGIRASTKTANSKQEKEEMERWKAKKENLSSVRLGMVEKRNEELIPLFEKIGFKPAMKKDGTRDKFADGRIIFVDKEGKKANEDDYFKALNKGMGKLEMQLAGFTGEAVSGVQGLVDKYLTPIQGRVENLQNQYNDASLKLDSIGKNTQDLKGAFQRGYDAEMNKQSSISSQTNNMSGNGKIQSNNPIKSHHPHTQHIQHMNAEVV
jgi:hypothetical protein